MAPLDELCIASSLATASSARTSAASLACVRRQGAGVDVALPQGS